MKKWVIGHADEKDVDNILESGVTRFCAEVLAARGIKTAKQALAFLDESALGDPFELADMEQAADAINNAIDDGKNICIYGDYDCDGIASTAMLCMYLECMGAHVSVYIPERSEGFGMNCDAIRRLASDGIDMIITVDNGISAIEEAALVRELGMELVITDHHQPSDELPEALAVVDPHRYDCVSSFKNLCGAGVVLKLIAALEGGDYELAFEQYGDLAALATVADIVEISGENRYIVKNGLALLENTDKPGIAALIDACGLSGKKLDSNSVGFYLAPKINASGRFASPKAALELMLCDDEETARELAQKLVEYNNERKLCESEIIEQIEKQIAENPEILCQRLLLLSGENWNWGVIGIICSKMVERYSKPCFIVSSENGIARGSARSFEGFSIFKSLEYCRDFLDNYGGHLGAGGFSLKEENIDSFFEALLEYADESCREPIISTARAEKILRRNDFSLENVIGLEKLAPFGASNPEPLFVIAGARIDSITSLSAGRHSRLKLYYDGISITAPLFGVAPNKVKARIGEKIDALVNLCVNEWNGRAEVCVRIKEYRVCGINQKKYFDAKQAYEDFICGKQLPGAYYKRMLPAKVELSESYKQLYAAAGDIDTAYARLCRLIPDTNYCRFRIAIDIFEEFGLVEFDRSRMLCSMLPQRQKVDILSSDILAQLSELAN